MSKQVLEGILLAADVQPDTDVVRRKRDDGERWLIHLDQTDKRKVILEAINKVLAPEGKQYRVIDQRKRGSQDYLLAEVPLEKAETLRLIFQAKQKPRASKAKKPAPKPAAKVVDTPVVKTAKKEQRPRVAIILDDIGHKPIKHLKSVLDLRYPITFAVLPYLGHSKANALYLHQNQYEVILHMPMEPGDYPKNNPGKGAILSHLNDGQIRQAINAALNDVPFVQGVNNHMGSKITTNRTLMRSVLSELKKRNMFFLDSRTHPNSVAFDLARMMGMTTAQRDVFLDSEEDYDFVVKQLNQARAVAKRKGLAVVIGHPYPSTLAALVAEMPKMEQEGFQFVFSTDIVRNYSGSL